MPVVKRKLCKKCHRLVNKYYFPKHKCRNVKRDGQREILLERLRIEIEIEEVT